MQNNLVGKIFFVLPKVTLVNCSNCKEERQQSGLYVHNSRRVNLNPHGKNTTTTISIKVYIELDYIIWLH